MIVNTKQATDYIITAMKAGLVIMLQGDPGIGKSAITHALAKRFKLKLIDVRLSQCDPVDLNGFPKLKDDIATYVPMDTFPIETTPVPKGYTGFLLFLDEFNSSSLAVQAASLTTN